MAKFTENLVAETRLVINKMVHNIPVDKGDVKVLLTMQSVLEQKQYRELRKQGKMPVHLDRVLYCIDFARETSE